MNPEQQNRASDRDAEDQELKQLKHLLRQAIPPLPSDQLEPRADLWPQLRVRIESQSNWDRGANSNRERRRTRVPWFDWALAALAAAALLIFPGIIPALLYHF
ncbi:MAG TPA: hypothetical protein VMP12_04950 [Candidatus Sulfotelmatobacter sp.]|nr:hypothetical protein [Candidatus Sulfotelmatobacter sp.]